MRKRERSQKLFDHGTANESNAVATMVATFLPAILSESLFYEEGCYILKEHDKPILIVSPDGSIKCRDKSGTLFGIEIKCPYPGKSFTTQVHYSIPNYYVSQILSEMHALKVDQMLFLLYSEEH